jgi:hypothetical protein
LLVACGSEPDALTVGQGPPELPSSDAGGGVDAPVVSLDAQGPPVGPLGTSDGAPPIADAGNGLCALGSAGSVATTQSLNLFGQTVYFEDGGALPAGTYRIAYRDGCMKYGTNQGWACNGAQWLSDGWYVVGATTSDRITPAPCTWATNPLSTTSDGMFASFDDCVDASLAVPPIDFAFDGGPIGVWLSDYPYSDNTPGESGRNPKFSLTLLAKCPVGVTPVLQ